MGVRDVGRLSLGEYAAICRQWAKAHGQETVSPPSDAEFDLAVMNVRGVA